MKTLVNDAAIARIVAVSPTQQVAFPLSTSLEVLASPDITPLPAASPYTIGMIQWQNNWIPLLDMHALIYGSEAIKTAANRLIMVLAFRDEKTQQVAYGAIHLQKPPTNFTIQSQALVALPDDSSIWQHIALSCFTHDNIATPIISTHKLFNFSSAHAYRSSKAST